MAFHTASLGGPSFTLQALPRPKEKQNKLNCPHLTDENIQAQKGKVTFPTPTPEVIICGCQSEETSLALHLPVCSLPGTALPTSWTPLPWLTLPGLKWQVGLR